MRVRAARGAIAVADDTPEAIKAATARLLGELFGRNDIDAEDLISILFTATEDLSSAFPAEAAREMGLSLVPLLCAREIPVRGSMASVVRVLATFHSDRRLDQIAHVYLDGAESLRDDLDS